MDNSKVAIVTDSNSGLTTFEAYENGITVIPMPFMIGGENYLEGIDITQDEFYTKLENNITISTSQPEPGVIIDTWNRLLKDYESIVHIPMSSGLSSSCATAMALSEDFGTRVQVVDNRRISVTQMQSVLDARTLANNGLNAVQIKKKLLEESDESLIYIMVDTLKYLKKGGRITPAAAAIGTVLGLKPVLQIKGDKLDAFSKARNYASGKKIMLQSMLENINANYSACEDICPVNLYIAYSGSAAQADIFKQEARQAVPEYGEITMKPLPLSISCHIGPGAVAIAYSKKLSTPSKEELSELSDKNERELRA
jgi:DegV family protein with EDD domain